jgi:hypothetical protein
MIVSLISMFALQDDLRVDCEEGLLDRLDDRKADSVVGLD